MLSDGVRDSWCFVSTPVASCLQQQHQFALKKEIDEFANAGRWGKKQDQASTSREMQDRHKIHKIHKICSCGGPASFSRLRYDPAFCLISLHLQRERRVEISLGGEHASLAACYVRALHRSPPVGYGRPWTPFPPPPSPRSVFSPWLCAFLQLPPPTPNHDCR